MQRQTKSIPTTWHEWTWYLDCSQARTAWTLTAQHSVFSLFLSLNAFIDCCCKQIQTYVPSSVQQAYMLGQAALAFITECFIQGFYTPFWRRCHIPALRSGGCLCHCQSLCERRRDNWWNRWFYWANLETWKTMSILKDTSTTGVSTET